jgi:hypothetical protein
LQREVPDAHTLAAHESDGPLLTARSLGSVAAEDSRQLQPDAPTNGVEPFEARRVAQRDHRPHRRARNLGSLRVYEGASLRDGVDQSSFA